MRRLGLGLGLVLGLGLRLALGLQLGIGIGFRRNHSWSSTFTPRRNHSLCLQQKLVSFQLQNHTANNTENSRIFMLKVNNNGYSLHLSLIYG